MGRGSRFHLYLHLAVGRVHVVELLHAAGAEVALFLGVEEFIQVKQAALATQEQAQSIEAGILITHLGHLLRILMQERRTDEHQASEVEIVADGAWLVVDDGMRHTRSDGLAVTLLAVLFIAVAIDQGGIRVGSHAHHTHGGVEAQQQRGVLGVEQHEVCRHLAFYFPDGGLRLHAVDDHKRAVGRCLVLGSHLAAHHQKYMMYHSRAPHLLDGGFHLRKILAGQKTVNLFSHSFFWNMFAKIQQNFDSSQRLQINLTRRGKDFRQKGLSQRKPRRGPTEMFVNILSLFRLQNSRGIQPSGNRSGISDFWPFLQLFNNQPLKFSRLSCEV